MMASQTNEKTIELGFGRIEDVRYIETTMLYHVSHVWPRAWQLPDGLVVGDVRHEAARGPMWPHEWTAVRKAVLEVVL